MPDKESLPELTAHEQEVYSWQTTIEGFGEKGQRRLKAASVMVSRIGGLGGLVAYELAAAGARTYLQINCAHCHRRGGGGTSIFETRIELDLNSTQMLNHPPTQGNLGIPIVRRVRHCH